MVCVQSADPILCWMLVRILSILRAAVWAVFIADLILNCRRCCDPFIDNSDEFVRGFEAKSMAASIIQLDLFTRLVLVKTKCQVGVGGGVTLEEKIKRQRLE